MLDEHIFFLIDVIDVTLGKIFKIGLMMSLAVLYELIASVIFLVTALTGIWFSRSMSSLVIIPIPNCGETFPAVFKATVIWFLSSMSSYMNLKIASLFEQLFTAFHCFWIHEVTPEAILLSFGNSFAPVR